MCRLFPRVARDASAAPLLILFVVGSLAAQQPATRSAGALKEIAPNADATVAATQEYLKTGQARPVRVGDALVFPYGKSQPTLTCIPLRTCLIQLQPGEIVQGPPALGDSE